MAAGRTGIDTAAVFCGGRSRRMGRDKARLKLGETTLLERTLAVLDELGARVVLACGPEPRYAELGRALVLDGRAGSGPLAGLEALLVDLECAGGTWLAVLACDMPRAEAALLRRLRARAGERGLDACLFATDDGVEPLCAVYHVRCLPAVRRALDAGERKMIAFHHEVAVGALHASELSAELRAREPARNLNTPTELTEERRTFA